MTYVVESGASPGRRARRKRAAITLLIVVLMLFFAFWYAYSYYRADPQPAAAPAPTCTPTATPKVLPKDTIVNVYNATGRSGLAAKTATEVTRRGFVVDRVTNDPLKRKVAVSAEVRYGPKGLEQAKLLRTYVAGTKAVKDTRTDASVDLVLGAKFTTLVAPTTATSGAC